MWYFQAMGARTCRVSIRALDGATHTATVSALTLFEAAAAAVSAFRQEPWAADALTPNAVLQIEVQTPPVVHTVPLSAVERWRNRPSASPRDHAAKRRFSGG
jgi:hypothetical protein